MTTALEKCGQFFGPGFERRYELKFSGTIRATSEVIDDPPALLLAQLSHCCTHYHLRRQTICISPGRARGSFLIERFKFCTIQLHSPPPRLEDARANLASRDRPGCALSAQSNRADCRFPV